MLALAFTVSCITLTPLAPLSRLSTAYSAALTASPLVTNVATAAVLCMAADGASQTLECRRADVAVPHSYPRTAWAAVWGGVICGWMLHHWFYLLGTLWPAADTSNRALLGKLLTNQLVMSPVLNAGFFTFVVITRVPPVLRMPLDKRRLLGGKIRQDLPPTILRSCCFWLCVQTANFRLLPVAWQTGSTNAAFLLWNTYLSTIGYSRVAAPTRDGDKEA